MTDTPTTQAGRELLDEEYPGPGAGDEHVIHNTRAEFAERILAIEAEARGTTGLADNEPKGKPVRSSPSLREALEHLLDSSVEVEVRAQTPEGDDAFVHAMTFEAMDRARAALAAAPPEPRCVGCGAVWDEAHERLAALREGGEQRRLPVERRSQRHADFWALPPDKRTERIVRAQIGGAA